MSTAELLAALKDAQISLAVDGEVLVVRGNKGSITEEIKSYLKKNKEELIAMLKAGGLTTRSSVGEVSVAPPAIQPHSKIITPEMLPLIELSQEDINRIIARVPGGIPNIQDIYAFSPLQDGILFHHLMAREGDPYLLRSQMAFPERGLLDRFLSAVQQVVNRHDILRTAFVWEELSQPAQVVWRQAQVPVTEMELDPKNGSIAEQMLQYLDPRRHRFDLTQSPLLRYLVAHDPEHNRWLLLQGLHHLVGDHSTLDVLRAEINAFLAGQGHTLAPPQPFRNLVAQARLSVSREEHERFFREMLGDITEPTLPFGLGDIHQDGEDIIEAHRMLPQELNVRLRAQARRIGVSLASLCHLAWGMVLARSSGGERVVLGTVLFGRMQAGQGASEAAGLFINTLPLRLDVDDTGTESVARRVHAHMAEILMHEHASLALAQRCSGVTAPNPLFSTILNYRYGQEVEPVKELAKYNHALADIELLKSEVRNNYPLTMSVEDFGQSLGLTALVVRSLPSERICGYMQQALESLAVALEKAPQTPIRELNIVPPEERKLLLETWNATETAYPQLCIHQLFEEQVARSPQSTAVVYEELSLSYAELNQQANQLAHYLLELGVKPEERVAICVERGVGMVVGLLAILKAGGAYVPLDPSYASGRLLQILKDARPRLLLSDAVGRKVLGEEALGGMRVLKLDGVGEGGRELEWGEQGKSNPDAALLGLSSQQLAYVIYTSGSTGTPKGVMVEHGSVVNFHGAMKTCIYGSCAAPLRVGWNASFSFDMSIKGLAQLLSGHCLIVIPQGVRASGAEMVAFIEREEVDAFDITPSQLRPMIAEGLLEKERKRPVLVGGEAVDGGLWGEMKNSSGIEFHNMYGPTECTVDATIGRVEFEDEVPHIGRVIANMKIYFLDGQGEVVPQGAVGEIYIGGVGVARGYLERPEMTAERFVPDGFSSEAGARMYKTGDVGRYGKNGKIEYLGRNDQQVKIRGFRIELGEIEARLREHELVQEAVVVAREDRGGEGSGEKRLVAYVVPVAEDREMEAGKLAGILRTYLGECLPEYMVPGAFVRVEEMPLTRNGKLDRKALPEPEGEAYGQRRYEAPQGEMEERLAALWQELLKVERVGRNDHFFELGGHSLLAVQLIQRLRRLNLQTEVRTLFTKPVLRHLAAALDQRGEVSVPPIAIQPDTSVITPAMLPLIDLTQDDINQIVKRIPGGIANIQDIYALSPSQDGILFHHLLTSKGDPYLMSTQIAFPEREFLDRFLSAVRQLIDRHDILRTAFMWEDISKPAQVVWRRVQLPVTELQLNPQNGPIAEQLAQHFDPRRQGIDLTQAPLLHFAIAHDAENHRWVLQWRMHHLIADQSTARVLIAEVNTLLAGKAHKLAPPKPYRNLVAQSQLGVKTEEHERFFRCMLGEITEPTLPFGLGDVHQEGGNVAESRRILPQNVNDRLRVQARRLGVSLASLCHAAWGQVVARICGHGRVVFGTVLFGRMQAGEGADEAAGLYVNTLPLRLDLDDVYAEYAVRQVHARLGELLMHEHASLSLAQHCSGVPVLTPLFNSVLNYRYGLVRYTAENDEEVNSLLGIEQLKHEWRTNYPLVLSVEDFGQSLNLLCMVVQPLSPERICGYMQQALESLLLALETSASTPILELDVLFPEERKLLLETWNTTKLYSDQSCSHLLFEEQVRRFPAATAVTFQNQSLSYTELNVKANRLAHYLIDLGVKPDDRVAICMERNPGLVIGLLAIQKAGGAYVPLDPVYPSERLRHILADAAPMILLSDGCGRDVLGAETLTNFTVIDLDISNQVKVQPWADLPETNPDAKALGLTPHHLAYVIYTSGSTGTPKGVMVEHAQVTRLFDCTNEDYGFNEHDVWCLFHSYAFDFSVWELWGALCYGGRLVVVPHDVTRSSRDFYEMVCNEGVTVLNQTPSAFKAFIEAQAQNKLQDRLRYVIFGGEALEPSMLKPWYQTHSDQPQLINMYGITETTVHVTYRVLQQSDVTRPGSPVGKQLSDLRIYLLDLHCQPVPLGAIGEIYVAGAGVARGYLNRPDLTAARFLPDCFSSVPGARMYKAGDLTRYLPDGSLEFIGRNDRQVKIRGFRIELGEIEACLADHPLIRQAVVLAQNTTGEKRLVAYVVPVPTIDDPVLGSIDATELARVLRGYLATRLPEYMVPAAFVRLENLPLTPNGKLDRKGLPAPDGEAYAQHAYEAPQGRIEEILAGIWKELLGVERVGRHDHFFELGGHSLLAVQLMERLRRVKLQIGLRILFTNPVLSELAAAVGHYHETTVSAPAIQSNSTAITPEMLPLINLAQQDIDRIVEQIPGGVANIQDIYSLTPLQDGILFHHMLITEGDPYVLCTQATFPDRDLLDRYLSAIQQIVDRHDMLRTSFIWKGLSQPAQIVWRKALLSVTEVDLDPRKGSFPDQMFQFFDPHRNRVDLTQAPLLRFIIAREPGTGRWLALQIGHHLIEDAVSVQIVRSEVCAILEGRGHTLPVPPAFRNFVAQAQSGMSQEEHECFFRQMLEDVTEPTLPFGLGNVHQDGGQITDLRRMLPQALHDRLRAHVRRLGISLSSLCHLAWGQVLARCSGVERVVFGTVLFGRIQGAAGVDQAVGFFINTLPFRLDLDDTPAETAVRRAHASLGELLLHENASLALALRCSGVALPSPLFSSVFNYRNYFNTTTVVPGNDAEKIHPLAGVEWRKGERHTNYPVTISFDDLGQSLGILLQVVQPLSAERVYSYFQQSLESLVSALETAPHIPVRQLEILSAEERSLLLETWNATDVTYPHLCLHQLFERQVTRTPEATAVVFKDQSLTYAEFNAQANRLAHYLIGLGVKADQRVAICLERSLAMMFGLFAILKAGAAYVPLDPSYPADRLVYMIEDSQATLVVTQSSLLEKAGLLRSAVRVICLDQQSHEIASQSAEQALSGVTPENLAYIYYTSGSTGRPKGVAMVHSGIVNYILWGEEGYEATGGNGAAVHSSIAVDLTLTNFIPLFMGKKVVLAPETLGVEGLVELIQEKPDWSLLKLTPTHLTLLNLRLTAEEMKHTTRVLVIGADNLVAEPTLVWRENVPEVKLLNEYGPTETVVGCSIYHIEESAPRHGGMPIGKPIANITMYVLDRYGQPVPIGVPGELCIGGIGVARCYWERPSLTAEKFVPDPFGKKEGARFYRTGDRARFLADGNLEFLGRIDHQVKIRGYRIEPAEVEAVLSGCPGVHKAMVVVREDVPGEKRLVGYVAAPEGGVEANGLRQYLREQLPEYMVPVAWVIMEKLPVRGSGKIDPKDLPRPEIEGDAETYVAPRNDVEKRLAEIWEAALGVKQVGIYDNFFELGGHSLLAIRLLLRVRQAFDVELPMAGLFVQPTLAQQAEALKQVLTREKREVIPPITPISREGALPLSFAQQRLWVINQIDNESSQYNLSAGLRLRGNLRLEALQQALDTLVQRHEVLRTSLVAIEGVPQQMIHPIRPVEIEIINLSAIPQPEQDARVALLAQVEANKPFDLAHDLMLRVTLIVLKPDEHVILFTQHHIASDGWSSEIMVREFSTLYSAYSQGKQSPLPALPIQYVDFAHWQREWLQGQILDEQLGYWRKQLDGAPPLHGLPLDKRRAPEQGLEAEVHQHEFDEGLTRALRLLSQQEHVTLFMLLQTVFALLVSRYSHERDVVTGTPVAGRLHSEVEPLIGFFVNNLTLRTQFNTNSPFREVLAQQKEMILAAYAHQQIPFEMLVEHLNPERNVSHQPIFQLVFHFNTNREVLSLPGLTLEPLPRKKTKAKVDLEIMAAENGERLAVNWIYRTDLFIASTINQLAESYERLLRNIVEDPAVNVFDCPVLDPEQVRDLLAKGTGENRQSLSMGFIHEEFRKQAQMRPDAVAVVYGERQLTYGDLNERSDRLARNLVEMGIAVDTRVGIYLRRSLEMIIGVMGIIKAGAVYVPLEPGLPQERVTFMLEDGRVEWVLTESDLMERLPLAGIDVVLMDGAGDEPNWLEDFVGAPAEFVKEKITGENLVYILYTSGSTGRPKGVMVNHRGLSNYVAHAVNHYFTEGIAGAVVSSPLSFDATITTLLPPLVAGKRVELLPDDETTLVRLAERLFKGEDNWLFKITPAHLEALEYVDRAPEVGIAAHRIVIGGEQLEAQTLRRWKSLLLPRAIFINEYGPTETVVGCTVWTLSDESQLQELEGMTAAPIGRAIANTQVYVLGEGQQPQPVNCAGELYIGGDGVACGYLNQEELTGERFVADPFNTEEGGRLYRTGDLAKWLPSGELLFLGRRDHQVKLRGYRIELGEIETTLQEHSGVEQVAVLAREDGAGEKKLVAYVVVSPEQQIDVRSLQSFLRQKLPEYMVPAYFVLLDELPLTVNGKVDHKALPKPEGRKIDAAAYVEPRNEIERALCQAWQEVLKQEQVGVQDNFFSLGGDSILAIRVVALLKRQGIILAIKDIFQYQTIQDLALQANQPLQQEIPVKIGQIITKSDEMSANDIEIIV